MFHVPTSEAACAASGAADARHGSNTTPSSRSTTGRYGNLQDPALHRFARDVLAPPEPRHLSGDEPIGYGSGMPRTASQEAFEQEMLAVLLGDDRGVQRTPSPPATPTVATLPGCAVRPTDRGYGPARPRHENKSEDVRAPGRKRALAEDARPARNTRTRTAAPAPVAAQPLPSAVERRASIQAGIDFDERLLPQIERDARAAVHAGDTPRAMEWLQLLVDFQKSIDERKRSL